MVSEIAELFEPNCTLHSHYQGRISIGGERIKDNIGLDKTTPVKLKKYQHKYKAARSHTNARSESR